MDGFFFLLKYAKRTRDFVLGISLADDEILSEATRLRLIYDILTSPKKSGGADISPHVDPFVASIMPLHNDNFNKVEGNIHAIYESRSHTHISLLTFCRNGYLPGQGNG
jgi:hypothetical protein